MFKKSPEGGRLCLFMPLPTIKKPLNIPHPKYSYRTQPIEPGRTIELDECFKSHTFALKFLSYVRLEEQVEETPPEDEGVAVDVAIAEPEALPVDTENLSPDVTQADQIEELNHIAKQLDPFTKDPGFAALNSMTAIQLAKFINDERGIYAKVPKKNSDARSFPSKDEWVSIARFGYTKDADPETGQLETYQWVPKWFTKAGGKLEGLYKSRRSRKFDKSQTAGSLQDYAYSKGWFALKPYELAPESEATEQE